MSSGASSALPIDRKYSFALLAAVYRAIFLVPFSPSNVLFSSKTYVKKSTVVFCQSFSSYWLSVGKVSSSIYGFSLYTAACASFAGIARAAPAANDRVSAPDKSIFDIFFVFIFFSLPTKSPDRRLSNRAGMS